MFNLWTSHNSQLTFVNWIATSDEYSVRIEAYDYCCLKDIGKCWLSNGIYSTILKSSGICLKGTSA